MTPRQFMTKITGHCLTCLLVVLLVPALCGSQNDKSKPAPKPANNNQSAPARPAPAQPAPSRPVQPPPNTTQQQRPTPGTPSVRPNPAPNAGGSGISGARPNPTPNSGGGGITGTRPNPTPNPGGGGISGTRPNPTPNSGSGGISGVKPNIPPRPQPAIFKPTPNMQATTHSDGTRTFVNRRTNTTIHTDAEGHLARVERPGLTATAFTPGGYAGHIVHTSPQGTITVDRGIHGDRRVEIVRPDRVRVVAVGRQAFVERPLRQGYVSRTYVIGGRTEVHVYRNYSYAGVHYMSYVPAVYYQPAFYGWAGRPWGPSVTFGWGWAPASPWFYGAYFAPEPAYASPALWLTDFLLAANLRAAYDSQQQRYQGEQSVPPVQVAQDTGVTLTPEIKMQIAEEVKQQLAEDQTAASQPTSALPAPATGADVPPPALKQRVFIVSASLDVGSPSGDQTCALTAGDIIERTPGQSITSDGKIAVNVMSSKPGDCPAEFATRIDVAVLQDMQNQFKEQLASGMATLASNQGKALPAGPAANPRPTSDGQAPPNATNDVQARELVAKLNQEADQTEADIRRTAAGQ